MPSLIYALDVAEELCVGDLAPALEVSEDSVSFALGLLRSAGRVTTPQTGSRRPQPRRQQLPRTAARHLLTSAGRHDPHRRLSRPPARRTGGHPRREGCPARNLYPSHSGWRCGLSVRPSGVARGPSVQGDERALGVAVLHGLRRLCLPRAFLAGDRSLPASSPPPCLLDGCFARRIRASSRRTTSRGRVDSTVSPNFR